MDLNNQSVWSDEQKTRLDALAKSPVRETDGSDIQHLMKAYGKIRYQTFFYISTKQVTTVRIDVKVMSGYRRKGKTTRPA